MRLRTDLVLASVRETATTLRPLQFDDADYPIYHRRQLGGDIWGISVDISQRTALGWRAKTELVDGNVRTYDCYLNQFSTRSATRPG